MECQQILVNITNIKYHKNLFHVSCTVPCRQEGQTKKQTWRGFVTSCNCSVNVPKNKQYFGFKVWKIIPTLKAVTVKISHLRHDAMQYGKNLLMFRMNLVPSLGLLPGQWRQQVPPKYQYIPTRLYSISHEWKLPNKQKRGVGGITNGLNT